MSDELSFFSEPEAIDRSTLESFSRCPMQARLKRERPDVTGIAAVIGNEGHESISRTITGCLEEWHHYGPTEISRKLEAELMASRPDVQPQVVEAFRPMVWRFGQFLGSLTESHILRYDGGAGNRSGQLAQDMAGFRLTSEDDLLTATQSKTVLRSDDWKSGWGLYDIDSIADAFQFQMRAWLTLENYPDCELLQVRVWNTRKGFPTPYVDFPRSRLAQYEARVREALDAFVRYDRELIERVPCWASTEKCRICDVAHLCPLMSRDLQSPPDMLRGLIAANARADALTEKLKAAVTKNGGRPIETPDGDSFGEYGAEKPRKTWKVKSGKDRE